MFTDRWGHTLDPTGTPVPPATQVAGTQTEQVARLGASIGVTTSPYLGPTGEKLDRWGFHLDPDAPDPAGAGPHARLHDPDDPPPANTGRGPVAVQQDPSRPHDGAPVDPTRAGPSAA